ncbi:Methionine gamma-lyase [Hartmannibacter diazotrophicus]|uniref:Methionine gamma-lyase n=1 Tax=Hartmannibacter diazotrophicus TaxID=1482074 RepID=A0A2C9D8L6_9HYPH|nr:PLP-dependent transferase [Hartmannibacter diazotrophicus]SON56674.1 Methionine gamma-lyase [Hartmannibacter diazotrophicus]
MNKPVTLRDEELIAHSAGLLAPLAPMPHDAVSPPIFQTSLFTFERYSDLADVFAGRTQRYIYSRGDNPTVHELEALVAALEGAEAGRGFSSGTAAIAASIVPFVEAGDRIVAVENLYSDAFRFMEKILRKFGVIIDYVDGTDAGAVIEALPDAKIVYLESPTSMVFSVQDIGPIAEAAQKHGVISIIDNSWATPLYQKPISHGVDLVVHAASKYLGGHSDTVAGVVVGSKALVDRINHESYHYLGGKLSPFEAWLILRGMRTLPMRLERHMQAGLFLGEHLQNHPEVERVRHPAFVPHPGNATLSGYGGIFAFDVSDAIDVPRFVDSLHHIRIGVSWGGPESLVVPALAALELSPTTNSFRRFGVSPRTVRLAAGHEAPELLAADIDQALAAARK